MPKTHTVACLLALAIASACSVPPRTGWLIQDGLIWYDPPQSLSGGQRRALEIARKFVKTNYPLETAYKRYGGLIYGDATICNCWGIQFTGLRLPGLEPDPIFSSLLIYVDRVSLTVVTTRIGQ